MARPWTRAFTMAVVPAIVTASALLTGCSGTRAAPRPAAIGHVVLIDLKDESDRAELIADADAMLATIPGVSTFAAGEHLDTGRSIVLSDYSVGLYIGFESRSALQAYGPHPQHKAFVEKWEPRTESLQIRDIYDPTP